MRPCDYCGYSPCRCGTPSGVVIPPRLFTGPAPDPLRSTNQPVTGSGSQNAYTTRMCGHVAPAPSQEDDNGK